jgi:poly(glycerol-phosphate) alpha-glucosyltransferase
MLDGRALARSRWRKAVARRLFEDRALEGASCLHAVSAAEVQAIRALGMRNPVCLIPNGVAVPAPTSPPAPWPEDVSRDRVLLYLGRLHAKKGLSSLLEAWERRPGGGEAARWRLVIAGWDDGEEKHLKQETANRGLEGVFFAGPLHGAARDAAYSNAHAFVMPSTSEGLPLAPLEAWSHALPVLMTDECNLPEGLATGASLRITPDAARTAGVLRDLFAMSDHARREMGTRGLELVRRRFSWEMAAEEMRAVCRWALGGGPPPASVTCW